MKHVKLYLNYAGHCLAKESHAISGGRSRVIKFHALYGLIQHPEKGWILFDTGYGPEFYKATHSFPNSLYAAATKVNIGPDETVASQLLRHQIGPEDIEHIIVSHFHADHIGGLKDFPNANFYCSKIAHQEVGDVGRFLAVRKGILPALIPDDFDTRAKFVEDVALVSDHPVLGKQYDLFGDESLLLHELPGHARGQLGLRITTAKQGYFLIADACWLGQSYQQMLLPHPVVRLFFDSWRDFKASLQRVHLFHLAYPEVLIVPTHCEATTTPLISDKIDLDAL
jgi:glyoxylase-like metal-dependent hydrolase (beta-lactamase superfamily II)